MPGILSIFKPTSFLKPSATYTPARGGGMNNNMLSMILKIFGGDGKGNLGQLPGASNQPPVQQQVQQQPQWQGLFGAANSQQQQQPQWLGLMSPLTRLMNGGQLPLGYHQPNNLLSLIQQLFKPKMGTPMANQSPNLFNQA